MAGRSEAQLKTQEWYFVKWLNCACQVALWVLTAMGRCRGQCSHRRELLKLIHIPRLLPRLWNVPVSGGGKACRLWGRPGEPPSMSCDALGSPALPRASRHTPVGPYPVAFPLCGCPPPREEPCGRAHRREHGVLSKVPAACRGACQGACRGVCFPSLFHSPP